MDIDFILERMYNLGEHVREVSKGYFNSRRVVTVDTGLEKSIEGEFSVDDFNYSVDFDIIDTLQIPILVGSVGLMTGATGVAKTHLANLVGTGFFGEGNYVDKTCVGLSSEAFLDFDFSALDPTAKANLYARLAELKKGDIDEAKKYVDMVVDELDKMENNGLMGNAIKAKKILRTPFANLNEPNQAHETLQAILIAYLDKIFNYEGFEGDPHVGVAYDSQTGELWDVKKHDPKNKKYFQSVMLSINEGGDYIRNRIDKAVRDRAVFEIPMDAYSMTSNDVSNMINVRDSSNLEARDGDGFLNDVIKIHSGLKKINIDPRVDLFLTYLHGLGNCDRSNSGRKATIDDLNPSEYCNGCTHLHLDSFMGEKASEICPNIGSPSPRSLLNLKLIAQGFAVTRAKKVLESMQDIDEGAMRNYLAEHGIADVKTDIYQAFADCYIDNLMVEIGDVKAAAPFVLYSKISSNDQWRIATKGIDNRWDAINHVVDVAYQRFKKSYEDNLENISSFSDGKISEAELKDKFSDYGSKHDIWLWSKADNDVARKPKQRTDFRKYLKK